MESVSFQPRVLTIRLGDSVVWLNEDPFPHTATSHTFDSKVIAAEGSWRHTPKAPGEPPVRLPPPPTMKATLRVQ
jgi:plastocyanin